LGWTPKISTKDMCEEMIEEDLKVAKKNAFLKEHGHSSTVTYE
jgi:GDPmannose 4,6-dehydratase